MMCLAWIRNPVPVPVSGTDTGYSLVGKKMEYLRIQESESILLTSAQ